MKTNILIMALVLVAFSACSVKEINSNVDSVTGDVSKAFDGSKDKSAD